jgi:nitroimidazol reductase NimA-like FMN-containing flavoprotein (pyridoxamine 5'-phosphate oxidase superfamily)
MLIWKNFMAFLFIIHKIVMMTAVALSKEEIEKFLSPPRMARLSTVRDDGRPHVVPVWYYYDGTNILVPTMKGSVCFLS